MQFQTASVVEEIVWTMKLADWPRAQNRARINSLFNGEPPYTAEEEKRNNIEINVNFLESTRLGHDARNQYYNAMLKPGNFFTARTDMGPAHKRQERSKIVTREVNRVMKRSLPYLECKWSKFAQNVLHGIGPSAWDTSELWCADPVGIEDVLVPSNTLRSLKNLPFFAIYRSYTAFELYRLTHGPKRDPAWNMEAVDAAIKWADQETAKLSGSTWPEVWSPEKMEERVKQDSGLYASDAVPTIDCYDFYFYNDENKHAGWNRRIVLDAYGQPGVGGYGVANKNILGSRNQFLYNPKDRIYASKITELIHFQFADLSAVAPFRYHSVRSLGFLLYAVCHLQNRMRCKFNEAVFEALMNYMRVAGGDEAERALKIELANRGIIDETVKFLNPAERWQVNERLAEMGLSQNAQIISENSASYVQNQNFSRDKVEKTKFQVMAEVNAMTTLISAALMQAYQYENFEYMEDFRRFCIKNSRDPDVREFRVNCLKQGVPEKMLVPEAWELEPERVMGAGNKTLEMAIAQQLMEWRPLYAPESQQSILRQATLSITDDPGLTDSLVPDSPGLSDAKHDAMLAFGSLMVGARVQFTPDQNRIDIAETLLAEFALAVQRVEKRGGMATEPELTGFQNVGQHIAELIQFIGQDKTERERAKKYSQDLGNLMNMVKAYAQRLAEQKQKEQQQNGQPQLDPKDAAKIQATMITAQAKAANTRESHAARTAQKQVSFELEEKRKQQAHQLEMRRKLQETATDEAATDLKTAAEIKRGRFKSLSE